MSNTNIEDLPREDLLKIIKRDRFVKEQLSGRIGALVHENSELFGVIQELEGDRETSNGDSADEGGASSPHD